MKVREWFSILFASKITIGGETLPFTWPDLFLKFLLPVAAFFILYRILLHISRKRIAKADLQQAQATRIFRTIRIILRICFLLFIGTMISLLFGAHIFSYIGKFFNILRVPFFSSGGTNISILTIVLAIPVFFVASLTSKLVRRILEKSFIDRLNLDPAKKFSVSSILRYGVMIAILLIGLSILGINLSSIALIFGVLGLGIGFGLQNVVANFFAGVVIFMTSPIKEGDRILIGETEGDVVKIRLLSSVIRTLMNENIIIPNAQLVNDKVYNFSYDDRSIYIRNIVQVAYSSNLDKVIDTLTEVGIRNPFGIAGEMPVVRVAEFADSGITMYLLVDIQDVRQKFEAMSWTNLEIWRSFKKHKIEIPFHQVDLRIK